MILKKFFLSQAHLKEYHYLGAIFLFLVIIAIFWPITVIRVQNTAKEEPQYIRRVFEGHTVGQSFRHEYYRIYAIDILARTEIPSVHSLIATDSDDNELGRTVINPGLQDKWFRVDFEQPLPPGNHTIIFKTEPPASLEQALLIRFQPQSDRYSEGDMIVDGKQSYGDIAFKTFERLPAWRALLAWGQVNNTSVWKGSVLVARGIIVAVIVLAATTLKLKRWPMANILVPLILLFFISVIVRIPYTKSIEGVYGGDAFNYLSKTNAFLTGDDPFAADPRKGPLYSVLLLPSFLMSNPLLWSRWVGIIAASLTASLLPLVARRFGLAWPLAVLTGLLVAVNQEFIWESLSGLANTLFAFLILLCIYSYLQIKTSKTWLWVLAVCSGLTMLTRFEGALVGAILLPSAWWQYRLRLKPILLSTLLAAAIMALPLISFFWSGVSGIRTPADISGDSGLFLVRSIKDEQLILNIERSYEFFTNLWLQTGDNIPIGLLIGQGLLIGVLLIILRYLVPKISRVGMTTLGGLIILSFLLLLIMNNEINREVLSSALYVLTGIGLVFWLKKRPWVAAATIFTILVQISTVIWILPKGRYFLPVIPFLNLAIVFGLNSFFAGRNIRRKLPLLFLVSTAAVFFYIDGHTTLQDRLQDYNEKAQDTAVLLNAITYFRNAEVRVGVHATGDVPTVLYIPSERLFTFNTPTEQNLARQEINWLNENNIEQIMERDRKPQWVSVRQYPEVFSPFRTFSSAYGDSRVFVYSVHPDKLRETVSSFQTISRVDNSNYFFKS